MSYKIVLQQDRAVTEAQGWGLTLWTMAGVGEAAHTARGVCPWKLPEAGKKWARAVYQGSKVWSLGAGTRDQDTGWRWWDTGPLGQDHRLFGVQKGQNPGRAASSSPEPARG